ncbi:hypothetical protein GCM10007939_19990 [Amylibacter marinus]|uniref:Uncharacterized protein n=1 Tax=Amylibacter marinus TaxID=1475483 RepID=A0ABQ5VW97_9RHOB|nr:hypothetical protein [Amylibacter marinus]GLQ35716.1 hypothetical protein GCM10007939_19990 [Amylibacter marinus]
MIKKLAILGGLLAMAACNPQGEPTTQEPLNSAQEYQVAHETSDNFPKQKLIADDGMPFELRKVTVGKRVFAHVANKGSASNLVNRVWVAKTVKPIEAATGCSISTIDPDYRINPGRAWVIGLDCR